MEGSVDFTVCSICLNNFTKPKIIDCFHSYCELCLENYVKKSSVNNHFPCPLCRKQINIPKGGVKGFLNNFYIKDTLNETEVEVCPQHYDEKSDKYCKECSMIACSECLKINHHDHKIICLKDAKEDVKQELEECKQMIHDQMSKFHKYIDNVRLRILDIQEQKCKVSTEIEEHVEKVCKAVRQCGKGLISQVTETSIKEERKLNAIIVDTKTIIHQSEATKHYGSHIVQKNNVEDMILIKKVINQQCQENKNRRLQAIPKINNLIFSPADSVEPTDFINCIGSLERIQEDILECTFNIDRIKNDESCSPIFRIGLHKWQIIAGVDTMAKGKSFVYVCVKLIGKSNMEEKEKGGNELNDAVDFTDDEENDDVEIDDISTKISLKLLNEKSYQKSMMMSQYHTFSQEDTMLEFSKIIYVKNLIKEGFINPNRCFTVRAYLAYYDD